MTEWPKYLTSPSVLVQCAALGAVALIAVGSSMVMRGSAAEVARAVPAPSVEETEGGATETAVLAGGCFWGVQGVFQHVNGVTKAVSGYAGGEKGTAHYEVVGSGRT